ncbi:MAG: 23S rRNA pseudouridine(2604) synthase RluF [Bacteroidia bacterium]|nr:23S rRNA pseudouridine(2604) synthase RluF [Bacteroidia bacterium]NNF30201.1 23S rRNA pseudouridine(2604) synthase RluF [Flavobacteriaceae bacterium]MBT8275476.1 23S rRNA pseudouridine(2604) synthase RluF [Bacteroidia bacterium]NNJ81219.1 23S rRNA pseudouridine(2604) synthase RluF [Flavobacteriaceae bacterium]NNK54408.1 23S rRNA pseudouridine(2604) synthase RluF [Flavobacteriaceae bacterium]
MHHPDSVRINKAISESGYCSRRQADSLIEEGHVTINGKVATLGDRVMPQDEVKVKGKLIVGNENLVYIALNKPVGITCTTDRRIPGNVVDFIDHKERIFHVGRLDKPSEGLLLMTNDGDIVNKILRAGNRHEKEYIVKVDRPITPDFLKRMRNGVPILDTVTKKCEVEQLSRYVFRIILVQGLNRQIRRMCEYLGYDVQELKRIRIMNIKLGNLKTGEWRDLSSEELNGLKNAVADSQNVPQADRNRSTGGRRRRK